MKKVETEINILKITIIALILNFTFYITNSGLCSGEFNRNTENIDEMETLPPSPDDYAEIEAKILKLSEELTYKNMQVAKASQGIVENPGVIKGKVVVKKIRSPEDTIVYIENVNDNNYKSVQKKHVMSTRYIAYTKKKGLPSEPPIMDQWNVEFIPHILPVLKGSVVDFPNTDTVRHNVYSPVPIPGTKRMLSLGTYGPDVIKTIYLDSTGEIPLRCNVHQEMSAFIVVLENPYFALTSKKGEFVLDNVPAGKYTLKTWHEKFMPVSMEVTVGPNQTLNVELPIISDKRDTIQTR